MTTPFDCTLNSISLSSLDDSICVLDIREESPSLRMTSMPLLCAGRRLFSRQRESISVQIAFAIHESDSLRREEVFQAVLAWAESGGLLSVSTRPGQLLRVVCTAPPALSAENWTETLLITFTSAAEPWWEAAELTQSSSTGTMTLEVPGNAPDAPVSAMVVNTGTEEITRLTLYCGGTQMVFEGISLPAGGVFLMDHAAGLLTAMIGSESVLKHRTPDSADLLLAPCGASCTAYASAGQPTSTVFSVRGRYL